MKKTVLTVLSMAIMIIAFSQSDKSDASNQGIVTYEEVVKFNIELDGMTLEMQEMLPKESRNDKVLYFNNDASLYTNTKEKDDSSFEQEMEGGSMMVMISTPENIVYRDFKKNKMTEQKEFMTRIFLIESDFTDDDWKFTGNQKMILDYPCQEATKQDGDDKVTVWFTPAIQVSSGPDEFANLPGLVLAVEANDGDRTILAKSINMGNVDEKLLQKPKKGKKVSQEKYLAIVEEKNKEMGGEGGAGGGKTMIMTISQ
ncbi:MAG: GLPGLI family protein [Bacteroidota bacterium]